MIDLQVLRTNVDAYKKGIANKGFDTSIVDQVLVLDEQYRELLSQVEKIRAKRNVVNRSLKQGRSDALITESKQLKQELKEIEPELKKLKVQLQTSVLALPNCPAADVPIGTDESGNVEVAKQGEKPSYAFTPKDHIQLGLDLDIIDLDRGAKVAGYRGYFLKNQAVRMHLGIMNYALDKLISKGFTPMIPPIVARKEAFVNSGHFPWGEDTEVYAVTDKDEDHALVSELSESYKHADLKFEHNHYLAGTAEVPLVSYHAGELLREKDLPLRYAGFSPCYRPEIGSYGRDTRGLYRVHEFMKIEQVILCANDMEESTHWHEELRAYSEEMLQELGLHYRVLLMCTGDMGEPQLKKYDIETWMAGRNEYGETMSDSIMADFQARRANIRYQAADGSIKYVHMLNNTALASPRILVALWEHYQQADGSILIPEVLRPYVGFDKIVKN